MDLHSALMFRRDCNFILSFIDVGCWIFGKLVISSVDTKENQTISMQLNNLFPVKFASTDVTKRVDIY